jgi:hypothetical protein
LGETKLGKEIRKSVIIEIDCGLIENSMLPRKTQDIN